MIAPVISLLAACAETAAAVGTLLVLLTVAVQSVGHVIELVYKVKGRGK